MALHKQPVGILSYERASLLRIRTLPKADTLFFFFNYINIIIIIIILIVYNNLKLFIESDQPCNAQLSVTLCYVGPANRAVKPVSVAVLDISSTR